MEVPDNLLCLFTAQLEEKEDGSYVIEVPAHEISKGQIQTNEMYHAALIQSDTSPPEEQTGNKEQSRKQDHTDPGPPVEVGEQRTVEIEDIGEQGDGIGRVERGYIVIVPETKQHERVTIEIKNVSPNVAFGEVIERHDHYE